MIRKESEPDIARTWLFIGGICLVENLLSD